MTMPEQFHRDRFIEISGFLEDPLLFVAYRYALLRAESGGGVIDDPPFLETPSFYADTLMEVLLEVSRTTAEEITGLELFPTYSFFRVYQHGDVLPPHKDRESCEISMSLCLGMDPGEAGDDYVWPIYMQRNDTKEDVAIASRPGDCAIFRGQEIQHWREPFKGAHQAQVFLHYVDRHGPYADQKWDQRRGQ